jgi:hypothetical protein
MARLAETVRNIEAARAPDKIAANDVGQPPPGADPPANDATPTPDPPVDDLGPQGESVQRFLRKKYDGHAPQSVSDQMIRDQMIAENGGNALGVPSVKTIGRVRRPR